MDRHVIGALEEGGVNREERLQPLRGNTASKKRGVFFRDAYIEIASRMRFLKMRQSGSARHRRRDCDDLLVGLRKFCERLADDF